MLVKLLKNQKNLEAINKLKYKKFGHLYLYEKIIRQKELSPGAVNFFNFIVNTMQITFEEPEARIIKQNDNR